jgi:hypothetical protein
MADESKSASEADYPKLVERTLRRGNINFDFLSPVQLPDSSSLSNDRRAEKRQGKRGLFNRGRKVKPLPRYHVLLWLLAVFASLSGLLLVWRAEHFLALLAVPLLLSLALASLIMLGLFLARPR